MNIKPITGLLLAASLLSTSVFAGPGHDHGESAFASGAGPATHFELTDEHIKQLGIETAPAAFKPIHDALSMLAYAELLPELQWNVSPGFAGRVTHLAVHVGQNVEKGQLLAKLKPLNVGSPVVDVLAEASGFIAHIHKNLGDVLAPEETLLTLGDASQLLVRGVFYETPKIQQLRKGQRAEVHFDSVPGKAFKGTVERVNRVIDPAHRTFSVYARVENAEQSVFPGVQGLMEVFAGRGIPVLSIPKRAILGELGDFFVYVMDGNHVEKRTVSVGKRSGQHAEITSGLFPSEKVVTRGNYQLQYVSIGGVQEYDHGSESHDDHDDDEGGDDHSGHNH